MATKGSRGRDPTRALQESVDRLSESFDRLAERLETAIDGNGGVGLHEGDKLQNHIRRFMPFYALGALFALMLIILPTKPGSDDADEASQLTPGSEQTFSGNTGDVASPDGPKVKGRGVTTGRGGGPAGTNTPSVSVPGVKKFDPLAWSAVGKTRGGFDCKEGVRQIPWSRYAVPCYPAWTGNNGGATTRGVTEKEIVVVHRDFPSTAASRAVEAYVEAAGFASAAEFRETRKKFVDHYNKIFELWGRKVKYITYESEYGNSTEEALSQNKDGACQDADAIISKFKPYLVVGDTTGVFGECAAERKLIALGAGAYYPETWYRKYHPYIFAGVMECERIAYMNAEYIGKRLANRPAKWSKDKLLDKSKRRIGIIVPENDQYSHCVEIAKREGEQKYNGKVDSTYKYQLDIQRFPEEAARAIVQFKADRITTIFLACDPIIPIFLTQSARGQEYFPEWVINSAGLTDVEQFARLWDQEEIQWSLFGMSQLGNTGRILGPEGEGTRSYKQFFGTDIPPGTQTEYYAATGLFSILQATGPVLTPQNMAATYPRLPPGGAPEFEVGYTSYATDPRGRPGSDHTAVDDMREVYWLCTQIGGDSGGRCSAPKSYDDKGGKYVPTYGGKRFRPGQWPRGDPPVFPEKP